MKDGSITEQNGWDYMPNMNFKLNIDSHSEEFLNAKAEAITRAMKEVAMTAESFAKIRCPVDTGNLRNSITNESDESTALIGTNVEYGKYQELGTYKMKAQPFMGPAFEENMGQYKSIIESALKG